MGVGRKGKLWKITETKSREEYNVVWEILRKSKEEI